MFFKEIHLTKNHWSVKVLDWAFPSLPTFYNFCPHFWMTILALILSPFIGLVKGIIFLAKNLGRGFIFIADRLRFIFDAVERKIDAYNEKMVDRIINQRILSDNELKGLAAYRNDISWHADEINTKRLANRYNIEFCKMKQIAKYYEVLVKTQKGRKYIDAAYVYQNSHTAFMNLLKSVSKTPDNLRKTAPEPKYKPEPVKLQNRAWWPRAILLAKILLTPVALVLAGAVAYGVYIIFKFIGWVFYWLAYGIAGINWVNVGIDLLVGTAVLGVITGIVFLIIYLIRWLQTLNFSMPRCIICRAIGKVFVFIFGTLLVGIFSGVGSVFSFFWIAIMSWKKDNCPAIIWEDKK